MVKWLSLGEKPSRAFCRLQRQQVTFFYLWETTRSNETQAVDANLRDREKIEWRWLHAHQNILNSSEEKPTTYAVNAVHCWQHVTHPLETLRENEIETVRLLEGSYGIRYTPFEELPDDALTNPFTPKSKKLRLTNV